MPDGTLNDTEILNQIEAIIDMHMNYMYDVKLDPNELQKMAMANFYMGQIVGILMKRINYNG